MDQIVDVEPSIMGCWKNSIVAIHPKWPHHLVLEATVNKDFTIYPGDPNHMHVREQGN
jgi:hypothetical protein